MVSRIIPSNNIEIINISKCNEKWTQDEDDLNSCMAVFFSFYRKGRYLFLGIYSDRHLFRRHLFPSPFIPSSFISLAIYSVANYSSLFNGSPRKNTPWETETSNPPLPNRVRTCIFSVFQNGPLKAVSKHPKNAR